jgi:hypothetical protein
LILTSSRDPKTVRITLVVLALLMSACTPSTTGSEPSTTSTSAGASSSAPTTGESAMELVVSSDQLTPGTYTRSDFTPRVTFAISGEWYAVQTAPGFFDVQRDVGSPDVIAVQFANVEAAYGVEGDAVPLASAADATAVIESNPDLTVLDTSESRMSGHDGYVVEVENATQAPAMVLHGPPGALSIDEGRRLWIAFFDAGDGVLAIMVGGSAQRWEEALLAAEPLLETVTIGE